MRSDVLDEMLCCTSNLAMISLPPLETWLRSVAAEAPWLIGIAIIAGTFIHEDLATVVTGMLVADGVVNAWVALPSLYAGIVLGDIGLYGMGRLIAQNRLSKRLSRGRRFSRLKVWLDERLVAGVFMVRFMPGLRMSAYTTYGFFAMPLRRFVISVVLAASIWTTALFLLSYKFAALTSHWLGVLRWPVLIVAVIVPLVVARHLIQGGMPEEDADEGADSDG
jgi:membrane protein DedA with SNARE-associated domain